MMAAMSLLLGEQRSRAPNIKDQSFCGDNSCSQPCAKAGGAAFGVMWQPLDSGGSYRELTAMAWLPTWDRQLPVGLVAYATPCHPLPSWAWWLDHPSPPPCSPLHQSLCDIRTGKEGKRVLPTRWSALFASGKGQLQSPRRMQGTFTKLPALGHSTEPSQQHFEVDIFIPIV